jgi:hypothetical protein
MGGNFVGLLGERRRRKERGERRCEKEEGIKKEKELAKFK